MNRRGLAQGVVDALPEPAFLLTGTGGIIGANRAARGLLGDGAAAGQIADFLLTPPDELDRWLTRSRATTTPMPGALVFRGIHGETRLRVHCSRVPGRPGEVVLLLRCADPGDNRFSILSERVRQLDAELRRRVREKAVLREALDENRNLMRELQHRVKNNIQMMISLLSMSAVNSDSAEVRSFVKGAKDRFRALATTQDLIYEAAQSSTVIPARELFERLARALAESTDGAVEVRTEVADVWLPQDSGHCLALIVNELVTNSIKHGINGGTGTVRVTLERQDGQLRLVVQDDGRGYPEFDELPRSSGLTLIRGLCRQIGAALELGNKGDGGGARTVVSFADECATAVAADGRRSRSTGMPASA